MRQASRWELEGIQSVYINGEGKVGRDEMEFCPTPNHVDVVFEITAGTGERAVSVSLFRVCRLRSPPGWFFWRSCCHC